MRTEAETKLRELLIHVVKEEGSNRSLTRTKLAKILWFSDFGAYRELGEPITGYPYVKETHGPMPQRMLNIELDLVAEGGIERITEGGTTRYVHKRDPDLSLFMPEQLDYVANVRYLYRHAWASYLSVRSHRESIGWVAAGQREEIPYATALLSTDPLSPSEVQRGQELAQQYGWV